MLNIASKFGGAKWLLALVLFSFVTVALFTSTYGFQAFMWDDSEYVLQGMQTADTIYGKSLFAWPMLVWRWQHYGKPPLYVNTLAMSILVFGRDHVTLAVGLLGVISSVLLAMSVYVIVRRFASAWRSCIAILAIAGLAGVGCLAPAAFPDVQLAACVVWTIALLLSHWSWRSLGLVMGLGMLAKVTFPFFIALPVVYAWWTSEDGVHSARELFRAGALGAAIAAVWYAPNLREAIAYATYASAFGESKGFLRNAVAWLRLLAIDGTGFILLAGFAVVFVWFLVTFKSRRPQFPTRPVTMLLLGAFPFLVVVMRGPSTNSRHPLPSLVLLAIAGILSVYWIVDGPPRSRFALACWVAAVIAQWGITKVAEIPAGNEWLRASSIGRRLEEYLPALRLLRPKPNTDVEWLTDFAASMGPAVPRDWYLSGDDLVSVPRLALAAYAKRIPIRFEHAQYFNWSEARIRQRIGEIARRKAILVVANQTAYGGAFLNVHAPLVRTALGRFRALASHGGVSVYASEPAPPGFPDMSGYALEGCTLKVDVRSTGTLACSIKLMLHAFDAKGKMSAWDQTLTPPACEWEVGETRPMSFRLPENCRKDLDHLEIGFFDEVDREHGWPPIRLANGRTVERVMP